MAGKCRYGEPPRSRNWVLRSYLRGVGALVLALAFSFVLLREGLLWALRNPVRFGCDRGCDLEALPPAFSRAAGFDVTAPVHQQFATFLTTRLTTPLVAGFVVGGAVLALVLRWHDQTASPEY